MISASITSKLTLHLECDGGEALLDLPKCFDQEDSTRCVSSRMPSFAKSRIDLDATFKATGTFSASFGVEVDFNLEFGIGATYGASILGVARTQVQWAAKAGV